MLLICKDILLNMKIQLLAVTHGQVIDKYLLYTDFELLNILLKMELVLLNTIL